MKADLQKKVAHKKEYGEIYLREKWPTKKKVAHKKEYG